MPKFTPVTRKGYTNDLDYLEQPYEIVDRPLAWQRQGLQQTASGYGRKLTSTRCVRFPDGSERRIYITCFSNSGTAWINVAGKHVIVTD
jgi:hypothetical protein